MKNEPIRDEFLEKRRARQKRAKKRRLIASFWILFIVILITAVILSLTVFFPIENITVSGGKIYLKEEIIEKSGIKTGDNLFVVSEKKVTDNLKEKLPFVETVKLNRRLPGSLEIIITETKGYMCVNKNGVYYNISKLGWVLEKTSEKPEGSFEIFVSGVECKVGSKAIFKDQTENDDVMQIAKLLKESDLIADYIDISNNVSIKIGVLGRFDVNLGTENSLENKIKHLKEMTNKIADYKKGNINLSMWNDQKPQGTFVENNTK